MDASYLEIFDTLRRKLEDVIFEKSLIDKEITEYNKFEQQLLTYSESSTLHLFKDIGEKCYVQASVESTNLPISYLHIGLGIHVQFHNVTDMFEFVDQRKDLLRQKSEYLSTKVQTMKNDVDQVEKMLNELKSLS